MSSVLKQYLLLITLYLCVINAQASSAFVFQESSPGVGDFSTNRLGTIESFNTAGTLAGFYNYGNSQFRNSSISLTRNQSHLFLVDASDGLGLFIVHDDGRNGNAGGRAEMLFNLQGDTAALVVEDDPTPINPDRDSYTGNGSQFTTTHRWINTYTDGTAIGSLDGSWLIDAQFADVSAIDASAPAAQDPTIDGLSSWAALSADGLGGQTALVLTLEEGRRVRVSAVPIPAALWLFGGGVIALIGIARNRAS